jgi:serine/threonine protein kinase
MEFCQAGDLEGVVRRERALAPSTIRSLLFQMCFALYTTRDKLQLRHFDLKLLNFFATDPSALVSGRALSPMERELGMTTTMSSSHTSSSCTPRVSMVSVDFGEYTFSLPLEHNGKSLLKLADFGTSMVGAGSLGDRICLQHFTTLENTPVEFLLLGSRCRQAFSSDTFQLGLCVLHMLTGHEPYEELLSDVTCPSELRVALGALWMTDDVENEYHVIREVVDTLEVDAGVNPVEDAMEGGRVGAVLFDTLYRYLVLFDACDRDRPDMGSPVGQSHAWHVCLRVLGLDESIDDDRSDLPHDPRGPPESHGSGESPRQRFRAHRTLWSMRHGTHPVMQLARQHLRALGPDMESLVRQMVHFDPSYRCTMHEMLMSDSFACLRHISAAAASTAAAPATMTTTGPVGRDDGDAPMQMSPPAAVRNLGARFGSLGTTSALEGPGDGNDSIMASASPPPLPTTTTTFTFRHYGRSSTEGGTAALPIL